MRNLAFPYRVDGRGRTVTAGSDDHVRQMLEQLLFTRPGERLRQPTLGCGLMDLLFGPTSPEVAAAVEATVATAVAQWLGDVIALQRIDVTAQDSTLLIDLGYVVLSTGAPSSASLSVEQVS